jgi:hypothetical protein
LLDESTNECEGVIKKFSSGINCLFDVIRIVSGLVGNIFAVGFDLVSDTGIVHGCSVIGEDCGVGEDLL